MTTSTAGENLLVPNMTVDEMYRAIVVDFEVAWAALAAHGSGGGNLMLTRQAMTLLEWACRLCASDATGDALRALSGELRARDEHYFTELPGACRTPGEFELPHDPAVAEDRTLLSMLFDLVRHGGAHQYQQITAELKDGFFTVPATGTAKGYTLEVAEKTRSGRGHLGQGQDTFEDGTPILFVLLRPELMFLDVKVAIERSGLLTRGLSFEYLRRGGSAEKGPRYDFKLEEFSAALKEAGHGRVWINTST